MLNPNFSKYASKFDFSKYFVTTFEPGAKEVLTHDFTFNPNSMAF